MNSSTDVDQLNPEQLPGSTEVIPSSDPAAPLPELTLAAPTDESMREFYELQQELLIVTFVLSGLAFVSVWILYPLSTAISYLLGACTGVVYLRMLSKNVAQLGRQRRRLGTGRLAVFIGLIIVATQWQQLEILPIFLGFLTYKAAVIVYTLRVTILPK